MPENSKRVAVDSHPRLSGIMDTVSSTLAHGPETRLPKEFYDQKGREIIDKISVEEWFSGYNESLGIGALMGDIVSRMVGSVEKNGNDGPLEVGGSGGTLARGRGGETAIKLGLSGCHDTTLAGVLVSLGAFDNEPWPPYTSHIALELFRKADMSEPAPAEKRILEDTSLVAASGDPKVRRGWFGRLFGDNSGKITDEKGDINTPLGIARKNVDGLTASERSKLDGYFVRIRYNDKVMAVPG